MHWLLFCINLKEANSSFFDTFCCSMSVKKVIQLDDLGDNYIHYFHLGRYISGYMVGNLVLLRWASRAVKLFPERISDNIPHQMKISNMVIPILMHL